MTANEGLFSLYDGDVLDLSGLSGTLTNTLRICGNATIIGGGTNNMISGLTIENYGGSLTVSNLYLSSTATILHNVSGPLTLVAMGSNCLRSSIPSGYANGEYGGSYVPRATVTSESSAALTITGPGSLVIENTSTVDLSLNEEGGRAVLTTGGFYVSGASNLTVSAGATSIQAGGTLSIVDSKVTSRVSVEGDIEFTGNVQLQNCALNMSYGTINPHTVGNIAWLGKIRSSAQFNVKQSSYVFPFGSFLDAIYIKLVGTGGTSGFENMNFDASYYFESSGTVPFSLSYSIASTGGANFQGLGKVLSIQMYKQDDMWTTWTFDWADIVPNVSGDVASSYHVAGNGFVFNSTATQSFSAVEQNNPFNYTVNTNAGEASIIGYTGTGPATIPTAIHGYEVTSIGTNAFQACSSLSGVGIGSGITSIGSRAFYSCSNLTSVGLSDTVTNIGSYAFSDCKQLPSILIPDSVASIGDYAFQLCTNLTGVYFQGNAPSLGLDVFSGDPSAISYYFSGTTNWPAVPGTFGGSPLALWLTVNGGTDGGSYTNLQQVAIRADAPAPGTFFGRWTGATQHVASVTSSNTTVNMPTQPVTLTATYYQPPIITAQPAAQAVLSGLNATFNVAAGGTAPLAYQWYLNNSPLSGAVGTNCILTGVTPANAGNYTVVVTNSCGSTTSSVAVLTVLLPPSITTQPASQVAAVGGAIELSVSTTGTGPLSFQWFKDGAMVLGATNSPLNLAKAGVTDSGVYYVVVANEYGLTISLPATVTVGAPQLLAWGNNSNGQLGNGTTTQQNNPVSVASDVVAVAAGGSHSLSLKSNGTLWAMGNNGNGQLGDGTTTDAHWPESVASNVVAVAAGQNHSLYLKSDGTLWAMGYNGYGQLGNGTTTEEHVPESVASNVVAVAAGANHSLYLKSNGTLWTMGYNNDGELGNGTTVEQSTPGAVLGGSNVVAVAGGAGVSYFMKSDGTLWTIGYNGDGELGDGTKVNRSTPVAVLGGSNVVAASGGANHSVFLKSDGTLWAMGYNGNGQLGDGSTSGQASPESVGSNAVAVAAGAVSFPVFEERRHVVGDGQELQRPVGGRNHDATDQSGVRARPIFGFRRFGL